MKKKQISIISIKSLKINVYLIKIGREYILVDAGFKSSIRKIGKKLKSLRAKFSDIKLIIITHAHYDHVRGLYSVKSKSGAPVLIHKYEKENLEKGITKIPHGTKWFTKIISIFGRKFIKQFGKFQPVKPDIVFEDYFDLNDYGLNGKVIHTPGHSKGSLCVIVDNKYCVGGDTFFNVFGSSVYPLFANIPELILRTWEKLEKQNCKKFYPGHGRTFTYDKFKKSLNKLRNIK